MIGENCTCPRICVGAKITDTRTWGETCAEHGVGTQWFREHPPPFGYADVRDWSREQFLAWLSEPVEKEMIGEPAEED